MRPSRRALSGALCRRLRQGGPEPWLQAAAVAGGALPGPVFSENSAARDSRQFTSIRNLSSECLVLEARALEVLRTVPGGASDRLWGSRVPSDSCTVTEGGMLEMALLPNACSCHFRIPIRHTRSPDRSEIGGKGRVEIDFLQRLRRRMIEGINICLG